MSRVIRLDGNKGKSLVADTAIPPGAYVSKFYREGSLVVDDSGFDSHPTGARLIKLIAHLVAPSTVGSVSVSVRKNEVEFYVLEIPQDERLVSVDLSILTLTVSMEFAAFTDTLQVGITDPGSGASQLTVLGVFNR